MSNILTIGKSALNAAQIGIATVGHNIANASTEGYNRQVVLQAAAQAQNFGYGYVGQGTDIVGIQRVYNDTLAKQLVSATATSKASETYYSNITQVNTLLSDSTAGLNPVITSFFSAVSAAASNPSDTASRQTLISSAQSLVNRFNAVNNQLNQMQQSINNQITVSVDSINSYAGQIATLNDMISKSVNSTGNPPNDLMDQRDQLVAKLSENIKTTIVKQDDGSYNVFAGSGMPLVVGTQQYQLYTLTSDTNPSRLEVAYGSSVNPKILSNDTLTGGTLGGVLQFRTDTLDSVQNQVGQLSMTLASQFNAQQVQGFDLNGTAGVALFNAGTPSTYPSSYNTNPNSTITVSVTDSRKLSSSDYSLKYNNGQYTVTRLSDQQTWTPVTLPWNDANAISEGITISASSAAANEGDYFLIKPTQQAASQLSLNFTDVAKLALAGSAATGPGDNVNGLRLAALQSAANVRVSGSSTNRTYAQAFSQMVSGVGTKTNELSITSKADATALDNATSAMQSSSGVNLDEEATDLLRYQQAYQAAGKMMQIASQLFEVLLTMGQ